MASPSPTHGSTPLPVSSLRAVSPTPSVSERVIERFGGIRPMAHKLEIPVTTVQGWKKRGVIPSNRLNDLCSAARRHGIILDENDLKAIGLAEALSDEPAVGTTETTSPSPVLSSSSALDPVSSPEPRIEPAPAGSESQVSVFPSVTTAMDNKPSQVLTAIPALSPNAWAGISLAAAVVTLIGVGVALINTPTSPLWQSKIGTLESQMSTVSASQSTTTAALVTRLTSLERSLPELERKIGNSVPVAQLLAMNQLRASLISSAPFTAELASVLLSGITNPGLKATLDRLTPVASGIATQDDLALWFPETAWEISQAATAGDPGARLLDRTTGWMASWARSLHRATFDPAGTSFRTILADAGAALVGGDLAGTVEQLSRLTGPAADAALPWLTAARARLTADQARALLGDHMLALSAPILPGLGK